MKIFLLPVLLFVAAGLQAQEHVCAKIKQQSLARQFHTQAKMMSAASAQISHEAAYDVKFVHLDLEAARNNKNIKGHVTTIATVTAAVLDTFMTLLHENHTIDSIYFNGSSLSFIRQDSMVKVGIAAPLPNGSTFTTVVYYQGTAPTGGAAIGSGYSTGTSGAWGNQATWSLSESFVAYHWWPCKQMLTDKIDSSWVFVTTDSTNKVGSNGVLSNVVTVGAKKRYEWKSRTPINYYLISVAIARYKEYNLYAHPQYLNNDSILIQNYIYDGAINNTAWINQQKPDLDKMPEVLEFLSDLYGMYPFYKEKYGNCMTPFSGGMEHQTMSSQGFFEYYLNAHELGHQWWGDNVTCKTWSDIWINEGFASYTEHLVAQYLEPADFAANLNAAHNNVMVLPGGSIHFTGADTMNTSRIFSSRLTYDKGGAIVNTLRFVTNNDSLWFNTLRGFQNTYKDGNASTVDFMNFYQAQTGIDPTQFFAQWYYGQGYPTFNVRYNYTGTQLILKSTQTVSMPSATPLFITPMEYRISRVGYQDTLIRVMHSSSVEIYSLSLTGTVSSISCDPNNWVINKVIGPTRDATLGITPPPPVDLTGIDEALLMEQLTLGPNPAKDFVTLSNPGNVNGQLRLVDLKGKVLLEITLQKETQLDMRSYAPGIYFLKVMDASGTERFTQKVIKN